MSKKTFLLVIAVVFIVSILSLGCIAAVTKTSPSDQTHEDWIKDYPNAPPLSDGELKTPKLLEDIRKLSTEELAILYARIHATLCVYNDSLNVQSSEIIILMSYQDSLPAEGIAAKETKTELKNLRIKYDIEKTKLEVAENYFTLAESAL
ncbi:MAG: hypothetical protein GY793_00330 [Proteobacteria bacterium]|nr:hypothetical protein [Pseudomonadota bacterium]